jgi:hypothetical protein
LIWPGRSFLADDEPFLFTGRPRGFPQLVKSDDYVGEILPGGTTFFLASLFRSVWIDGSLPKAPRPSQLDHSVSACDFEVDYFCFCRVDMQ